MPMHHRPAPEFTTDWTGSQKMADKPKNGIAGMSVAVTDVARLVVTILTIAAMWWQLRSDVRDLNTTMTYQIRLQEQIITVQAQDINDLKQVATSQQKTINDILVAFAKAGLDGPPIEIGRSSLSKDGH